MSRHSFTTSGPVTNRCMAELLVISKDRYILGTLLFPTICNSEAMTVGRLRCFSFFLHCARHNSSIHHFVPGLEVFQAMMKDHLWHTSTLPLFPVACLCLGCLLVENDYHVTVISSFVLATNKSLIRKRKNLSALLKSEIVLH